MAIEFTVSDLSDIEAIEMALKLAGVSAKNEKYALYMTELHRRPVGGIIRLEDEDGAGFEVGRISFSIGSFARSILTMTTFHNDVDLLGRLMMLLTDERKLTDLVWKEKLKG